jgi:hypothetical protein
LISPREVSLGIGPLPVKTRWGTGRDLRRLLARVVYTSFAGKGKAKSARSALCSNVEFVFTSGITKDYKTR